VRSLITKGYQVTQDAVRDALFRQEISHTGRAGLRPFEKFNREILDKLWPGPGSSGIAGEATGTRR